MEKKNLISARDLCIGYGTGKKTKRVHEHLSFDLHAGRLTSLLGGNGAGKSTLLRTLSGAQPALGGELLLQGRPLTDLSEKERSRTIGVVLTDKIFAGGLTVYELVALGRQPHTGFFGRLHPDDRRLIGEALEQVGISHKAGNYVAELSDGERQKVMIAKALVQECPLILLDEPTAFLDVVSRIEIMNLLHRLAAEQHKAILLSTHDIEQALMLSDHLWLLSQEEGLQCGVTEDIVLSRRMDSLFPHREIRFDYTQGTYLPTTAGQQEIVVEAEDDTLLHWCVNALTRQGYRCHLSTSSTTSAPSSHLHLKAVSPRELLLTTGKGFHPCTSFKELLERL
ncbi:MAG: ABC transporter ATP-binding protein [Bacteroides sp.]|nr:ABC transporter ATP-binding protein [Bacteroides sp.]